MTYFFPVLLAIALCVAGVFAAGRSRAVTLKAAGARLVAAPNYYGYFAGWLAALAALGAVTLLSISPGLISPVFAPFCVIGAAAAFGAVGVAQAKPSFHARDQVERIIIGGFLACSAIAVVTTFGIIGSLLLESLRFFEKVSIFEFLFGLKWSPQTALRADQIGQSGAFGAIPIFAGTFLIMAIALVVAAPLGLMIAIYLSEYAADDVRDIVKPIVEILAGVPTVVYGFFALLTVGPAIRGAAEWLNRAVLVPINPALAVPETTQSALAAGVVMGVMIIPFISSLSDDVLRATPRHLRDGSYALGATKFETVRNVLLPAALPGIAGALLLSVSRAIGETMIVVMAAGRAANLSLNPFEAVTTVTVQIVALLTGDQEFDSAKTLSAFALGLVLFIVTLSLNILALWIVNKYRDKYD